jgi:pimeloyl-ACP methyl ester carboxylesterase
MSDPVGRRFSAPGVELAADVFTADPSQGDVLLLHGGGQTRHSWRKTAAALSGHGWTATTLDTRGHGDSGWAPDGNYAMDVLVDDLASVAATIEMPPVLIGASMGGLTALAALGEGRVAARGLVLVDVAPRVERAGAARIVAFMRARPEGFASLEEAADAVAAYNPHRARPATTEGLRRNLRLHEDGRWHWHWDPAFMRQEPTRDSRLLNERRLAAAAQALTVPTLLVRGMQSDVVSTAGAAELLELVPTARVVDVRGTGHMVAGDDNDVFTQELLRFLDGLPR